MAKVFLSGASSGIGLATAHTLLAQNHEVWGTSRDPNRVPKLDRLHPVALDLMDPESIRAAYASARQSAGEFDVVINNAGGGYFGRSDMLPTEALQAQFQLLVFAHIEICRLALESMQKRGSGLLINVTSLAAELPIPCMAPYNAAKSAMAAYTMTLQLELAHTGIRIIDFQPADISTGFNAAVVRQESSDERLNRIWKVVDENLRKAPPPELVGERIAQLVSDPNPPPRVIVGDFFQSKIAPLLFQLLPQRVRLWGIRKYYGI